MKFDVVLPIVDQYEYTEEILGHFANQTRIPDKIIVIDNSKEDSSSEQITRRWSARLPISLQRQPCNIGYNKSIQLGVLVSDAEVVSILNNDLTIPPWFFEFVEAAFQDPQIGYVVPFTHPDRNVVISQTKPSQNRIVHQAQREGWAFSVRRSAFLACGQIPQGCTTFYGDDFIHEEITHQGYAAIKLRDLVIYHYVSRSLYACGMHETLGDDMACYQEFITERAKRRRK